jgi:23S rRNA pseudouridine1911/1915/1917 synthase
MNRTRVKQLLHSGRVTVNNSSVTRHDHLVTPVDQIAILRDVQLPGRDDTRKRSDDAPIYMDESVVVLDKPPGLLTVATESEKLDTAFVRLKAHLASEKAGRPFVVHRIDRETSGLLLFARSAEVRDHLQTNWEKAAKTYLAVVEGQPKLPEGKIENYLIESKDLRVRVSKRPSANAKWAVSQYRLIATRCSYSLVEVKLETGRKHQIRVHMAGLDCPVAGDAIYGATTNPVGRLGLHAWRLAFDHPITGKRIELESPFPAKLNRLVGLPTQQPVIGPHPQPPLPGGEGE